MKLDKKLFNGKATFECGQCFRWSKCDAGYIGVVNQTVLRAIEFDDFWEIEKIGGEEINIPHYFDDDREYENILKRLSKKDEHLKNAVSLYRGLRLLNQFPFEALISFIISANNNIPKIRKTIEAISKEFGEKIDVAGYGTFYTFPTARRLSEASLEELNVGGIGYRVKAVALAASKIHNGEINLENLKRLSYLEAKKSLIELYGVGDKVADCVLLFGLEHKEAFPIDVWVKRMLNTLYGVDDKAKAYASFVEEYFLKDGGYAQQFLFYYMRNHYKRGVPE